MKLLRKIASRTYQFFVKIGMAFMPWRQPVLLQGEGSFENVGSFLCDKKVHKLLVVCDRQAIERHALDGFFHKADLQYFVFDGVLPNPTVQQVEEALSVYIANECDGILAFGGGSVMDCAKAVGARVAQPQKSVNQMRGLLKVRKKLPTFVAVPTTAGTGSECTVAAVITDGETHDKYAINDFALIPHYAVLDPLLTVGLPPFLTATTGMDALTHAVEAYIGRSNTVATRKQAEQATKLIFENIVLATQNGSNLQARANMQKAAYLAGLAFTRAYVGNVHALAHSLGGKYNIAHGLANAILLPVVLKKYGKCVRKPLARLAKLVNVAEKTDSNAVAAEKFVDALFRLNKTLGIPDNFGGKILTEDLRQLAHHAEKEANPLYPVPQIWDVEDFVQVYRKVQGQ